MRACDFLAPSFTDTPQNRGGILIDIVTASAPETLVDPASLSNTRTKPSSVRSTRKSESNLESSTCARAVKASSVRLSSTRSSPRSSRDAHRNPTHANAGSHRFYRVSCVPPPRQSRAQSRARRREDRSLFVRTPPQPRSLDSRCRTTRWFRTMRLDDARASRARFFRAIPRRVSTRRTSREAL